MCGFNGIAVLPKRRKRKILFLFLLLFFLAGLIALSSLKFQYLVIEDSCFDHEPLFLPLGEGEAFVIKYTHSVDLLPVYEIYRAREGYIWLEETHFMNFGAGMGLLEDRGRYIEEDGMLKIIDIDEIIDPFILRTGAVADHRLGHRDRQYSLTGYFGNSARLVFQIRSLSGWEVLKNFLAGKAALLPEK